MSARGGGSAPPFPLLLCSASPRRAILLAEAGIPFERGPAPGVDETPPPGASPAEAAEALARRKARVGASRAPGRTVLAADTLVVVHDPVSGDSILGKPADASDARRMLGRLAGRAHSVVTGVAVARDEALVSGRAETVVEFRPLSAAEIAAYVAGGEPLDKAGAYAIQGGASGFVVRCDGPLDNVVGLPIDVVRALLGRLDG